MSLSEAQQAALNDAKVRPTLMGCAPDRISSSADSDFLSGQTAPRQREVPARAPGAPRHDQPVHGERRESVLSPTARSAGPVGARGMGGGRGAEGRVRSWSSRGVSLGSRAFADTPTPSAPVIAVLETKPEDVQTFSAEFFTQEDLVRAREHCIECAS